MFVSCWVAGHSWCWLCTWGTPWGCGIERRGRVARAGRRSGRVRGGTATGVGTQLFSADHWGRSVTCGDRSPKRCRPRSPGPFGTRLRRSLGTVPVTQRQGGCPQSRCRRTGRSPRERVVCGDRPHSALSRGFSGDRSPSLPLLVPGGRSLRSPAAVGSVPDARSRMVFVGTVPTCRARLVGDRWVSDCGGSGGEERGMLECVRQPAAGPAGQRRGRRATDGAWRVPHCLGRCLQGPGAVDGTGRLRGRGTTRSGR